jgi:hypothetical protein
MNEGYFDGSEKPYLIPQHWKGRALRTKQGWCWYDPNSEGCAMFIYKGDIKKGIEPHIIVCKDGVLLDAGGNPIPYTSMPND